MTTYRVRKAVLALSILGGLSAVTASGCGASSAGNYVTGSVPAREALDAALTAWQKGQKLDSLTNATPAVIVGDYQWEAGQKLESYQILQEEPDPADGPKRFSVTLTLKKPLGETKAEYFIIGREPIRVYRDKDYTMLVDMGDNPPKPKPRRR